MSESKDEYLKRFYGTLYLLEIETLSIFIFFYGVFQ